MSVTPYDKAPSPHVSLLPRLLAYLPYPVLRRPLQPITSKTPISHPHMTYVGLVRRLPCQVSAINHTSFSVDLPTSRIIDRSLRPTQNRHAYLEQKTEQRYASVSNSLPRLFDDRDISGDCESMLLCELLTFRMMPGILVRDGWLGLVVISTFFFLSLFCFFSALSFWHNFICGAESPFDPQRTSTNKFAPLPRIPVTCAG